MRTGQSRTHGLVLLVFTTTACTNEATSTSRVVDDGTPDHTGGRSFVEDASSFRDAGTGGTTAAKGPTDAGSARHDATTATAGYVYCPFPALKPPGHCSVANGDFCCHYMSPGFSLPIAECNSARTYTASPCFVSEYCDDDADCDPSSTCVQMTVPPGLTVRECRPN